MLGACGPWQRVGSPDRAPPGVGVAQLFDAATIYRSMGFLVGGAALPFVGSVHYLRSATSDSTLALCALSLSNSALSFHRDGNDFSASYHVDLSFRPDTGPSRLVGSDQAVRVGSFRETLRGDESIIFQQFVTLRPGLYHVSVSVRDRGGPNLSRTERVDTVPSFAGRGIATPIPYYEGPGRSRAAELPKLVANPRATLPFGGDTLRFYVEAYGLPPGGRLTVSALDARGAALWQDSVPLSGDETPHASLALPPGRIPLGRADLEVAALGGTLKVSAPFVVSLSDQWIITNFDQMVSLLRYFERQDLVAKLRAAPPDKRPEVWRDFWKATDPVPLTPENEALDEYFRRIQLANQHFQEGADPGWLTDRGEVFITLGDPDEVIDLRGDPSRDAMAIRWNYVQLRLSLLFRDETGFGRYRLTPSSRSEYQRVLARVRRAQ
jgi:GWxTD domain-containing protein